MDFNELNRLQKYLDNQVGYNKFIELMGKIYSDEAYAIEKWESFRQHSIRFITSRSERKLLKLIVDEMNKIDYKG